MTALTPNFNDQSPLYDQLYRYIVSQIRTGQMREGEKMPSKRRLAQHLGVSLTTVERSYGILTAEGYLESLPRSGYRVARVLSLPEVQAPAVLPPAEEREELDQSFSTSAVDTSVFPYAMWARLNKEAVYENPDLLQRGDGQGDWPLRQTLAGFLHQYRGVNCTPEQVVLGAGVEGLMWVLLQLLPGAVFGLEDPGYASLHRLLDNLNWPHVPVPVDGKGMSVEALAVSGANVAYVTPSHQFPLGVTTPMSRRGELLEWAYGAPGRYLIEDDYDSEFRYASRPIPAMQGLDRGERVSMWAPFPGRWPPPSAWPILSCPLRCWRSIGPNSAMPPPRCPGWNRRRCGGFWLREPTAGICGGWGISTGGGGMRWCPGWNHGGRSGGPKRGFICSSPSPAGRRRSWWPRRPGQGTGCGGLASIA